MVTSVEAPAVRAVAHILGVWLTTAGHRARRKLRCWSRGLCHTLSGERCSTPFGRLLITPPRFSVISGSDHTIVLDRSSTSMVKLSPLNIGNPWVSARFSPDFSPGAGRRWSSNAVGAVLISRPTQTNVLSVDHSKSPGIGSKDDFLYEGGIFKFRAVLPEMTLE
jgi:hypothetical protein